MNRITKLSLLSKERILLFNLRNPNINGEKELRLLSEAISGHIISGINAFDNGNFKTNRHKLKPEEIQDFSISILKIAIPIESIRKVKSFKKILLIKNNKKNRIYKQKF